MKYLILLIVLFGCGTTVKQMMMPSGKQGHAIVCKSEMRNCYEKAAELCPNGYKIHGQSSGTEQGFKMHKDDSGLYTKYEMMIECQ